MDSPLSEHIVTPFLESATCPFYVAEAVAERSKDRDATAKDAITKVVDDLNPFLEEDDQALPDRHESCQEDRYMPEKKATLSSCLHSSLLTHKTTEIQSGRLPSLDFVGSVEEPKRVLEAVRGPTCHEASTSDAFERQPSLAYMQQFSCGSEPTSSNCHLQSTQRDTASSSRASPNPTCRCRTVTQDTKASCFISNGCHPHNSHSSQYSLAASCTQSLPLPQAQVVSPYHRLCDSCSLPCGSFSFYHLRPELATPRRFGDSKQDIALSAALFQLNRHEVFAFETEKRFPLKHRIAAELDESRLDKNWKEHATRHRKFGTMPNKGNVADGQDKVLNKETQVVNDAKESIQYGQDIKNRSISTSKKGTMQEARSNDLISSMPVSGHQKESQHILPVPHVVWHSGFDAPTSTRSVPQSAKLNNASPNIHLCLVSVQAGNDKDQQNVNTVNLNHSILLDASRQEKGANQAYMWDCVALLGKWMKTLTLPIMPTHSNTPQKHLL
ncbi:hypothetical protein L204_102560 [Cryptococcus depauperatus]|nr:hypothetical protein L204_00691 [Cryptococcus depauperatus CBS 7855]